MGAWVACDLLRRADRNYLTAAGAAFRSEIDHPIGGLDDIEIVLDDDHRVAVIAQAVQDLKQLLDVVEVQTGGRLIEDVERLTGVAFGQFA